MLAATPVIFLPGNWNSASIWQSGDIGNEISDDVAVDNNTGTIVIQNGDNYTIGEFSLKNANTLIIESGASLVIGSNSIVKHLNSGSGSTLEISGHLEIWGNLNLTNELDLSITGTMIVHGDFNGGNDAILNIDGAMQIIGDMNSGNNSILTGVGSIDLGGVCNAPLSFCESSVLQPGAPDILNCPLDISVSLSGTDCDESVSWTEPSAKDDIGIVSFTSSHNPGDIFLLGTTTVTYTAIDTDDLITICLFDITVTDDTSPIISNCPTDISVNMSGSDCSETVSWALPTATDNCEVDSFVSTHKSGDIFPFGTTIVTYTASDPTGNFTQCSFNVTVNDNTPPIISNCPADIITNTSFYAECEAAVTWTIPTTSDNCGTSSLTSTHLSGELFPTGTTIVTYTATDLSGNSTTCSFDVTVIDNFPPVFDFCPTEVVVEPFDLVSQTAVVTWEEPIASDNCSVPKISSNFSSGDSFPAGNTKITYTATDNSGKTVTCEFEVIVKGNKVPTGSPIKLATYSGQPLELCLDVNDPDGDELTITEDNYNRRNGEVTWPNDDNSLCLTYTSNAGFEGEEFFFVTVCDTGAPRACINIEVSITVTADYRLTFYKAFTPNGDNINDEWEIKNIESYPNNHVMIYDRLGGLIYSAKGYNNVDIVWDGRSNQQGLDIVESGTYYYKIDLGNGSSNEKGFIELIR